MTDGPLIVQSDKTLLLDVDHPEAGQARRDIAPFAELERAPEHIHTYRVTRLGLWNARAAGHDADDMLATLERWSRFPVPPSVTVDIPRPRNRKALNHDPRFKEIRNGVIQFLLQRGAQRRAQALAGVR